MAPVMLKHWSPLFDPEREHIGVGPLCIRLPNLPLQYWSEDIFIYIGNSLGTYLDYDKSYIKYGNRSLARIVVYLDTSEELEEKTHYSGTISPGFKSWTMKEYRSDAVGATRLGTSTRNVLWFERLQTYPKK